MVTRHHHRHRGRSTTRLLRWSASSLLQPMVIMARGSGFSVATDSTGDTRIGVLIIPGDNPHPQRCTRDAATALCSGTRVGLTNGAGLTAEALAMPKLGRRRNFDVV